MRPLLEVQSYGEICKPFDLILFSPHGDDGAEFLEENPVILNAHGGARNIFYDFVALECDQGATKLAYKIAMKLSEETKFRCAVVVDRIPRAVWDMNRSIKNAARNIFNDESLAEILNRRLRQIDAEVRADKERILQQLSPSHGYVLDIHTMAAFSPVDRIPEMPSNMEKYIRNFVDA